MGRSHPAAAVDRESHTLNWPGEGRWQGLELSCRLADGSLLNGPGWSDGDTVALGPLGLKLSAQVTEVGVRIGLAATVTEAAAIMELRLSGTVAIHGEAPAWLLYDGYQSWDPSGYAPARPAATESWWTAGVASEAGGGLAIAGLSAAQSSIRFELEGDRLSVVWCEPAGLPLWRAEGGESRSFEPVVAAMGPSVTELLRILAGEGRPKLAVPRGWLSWYHFGPWVSREHVLANSTRLMNGPWNELGHSLVQIDDGWQAAYGDWVENEKFQPGLKGLAAELSTRGQNTGVWTAPFLVAETSQLAATAPDSWFVLDPATGLRTIDSRHVAFGPMQVLNGANPEVQEHLARTFGRLRAAGIAYFKIDFLYAGAYGGTAALRRGVEAIRRGAGDAYLLACGAPLLPMVGLVDGCRVGADTATPIYDFESGLPKPAIFGDEVLAVARNVAARHFLEGWFHIDADVALVGGNLGLEQGRQLVTVAVLSGGPYFSSDDLDSLDQERLRLLDNPEVLGLIGGAPAVPDWEPNEEDRPPSVWRRGEDLIAVFNWSAEEVRRHLELPGARSVRDLWARQDLDGPRSELELDLPAHGVRLLQLT